MSTLTIWHNPRCSKSRQALSLLEENGVAPSILKYLEVTPTVDEIRTLLEKLGMEPRELMRTKEALYIELALDKVTDKNRLIHAMAQHPKLIERPVVILGDRAVIGRPPEKVLTLIRGK